MSFIISTPTSSSARKESLIQPPIIPPSLILHFSTEKFLLQHLTSPHFIRSTTATVENLRRRRSKFIKKKMEMRSIHGMVSKSDLSLLVRTHYTIDDWYFFACFLHLIDYKWLYYHSVEWERWWLVTRAFITCMMLHSFLLLLKFFEYIFFSSKAIVIRFSGSLINEKHDY